MDTIGFAGGVYNFGWYAAVASESLSVSAAFIEGLTGANAQILVDHLT